MLSVSAVNYIDILESNLPESMALGPPNTSNKPPELTIKSQETTLESTDLDASTKLLGREIPLSPTEHESSLYDPDDMKFSWAPSEAFTSFLENNFRRKLSYDQVSEILENQAVPFVEILIAPTLDPSVVQHIAQNNRNFMQERDKELQITQRSLFNATGLLCTLHDRLENNVNVDLAELKTCFEQTLCLLSSANTQLSILRRKKALASINRK